MTRKAGITELQFYVWDVPLRQAPSALILKAGFLEVTNPPSMEHAQRYYRTEDAKQTGEILTSSRDIFVIVCVGIILIYFCCG